MVEIKCRRCGKNAKSEDFTVDYVYKMAVCPSCVKERKINEAKAAAKPQASAPKAEEPKKQMPPGWDADDEYLEKLARQKQKSGAAASFESPAPVSSMQKVQRAAPQQSQASRVMPQQQSSRLTSPTSNTSQSTSQSSSQSAAKALGMFAQNAGLKQSSAPQQSKPASSSVPQPVSQAKPSPATYTSPSPQPTQSKPMSVADFGMRSASRPQAQPAQSGIPKKEENEANLDKIKHKCKKCGYEFWYNSVKKVPKACPYCNAPVEYNLYRAN